MTPAERDAAAEREAVRQADKITGQAARDNRANRARAYRRAKRARKREGTP